MIESNKPITVVFLEGNMINLCSINVEHVDLYTKWSNDPDVRKYSRNMIPWNLEEVKKWHEQQKKGIKTDVMLEILHKKDNKPIGVAGLSHINWFNRNANLHLVLGEPEYWGQDIAPEVSNLLIDYGFEELNLHKIYVGIYSPNKRSLRAAEKVGFKYEATLREQIYIKGEYVNEIKFAIFKKDWLSSK